MERSNASKFFLLLMAALTVAGGPVFAKVKRIAKPFRYAGGTTQLPERCKGTIEVGESALTFKCAEGSVAVPYQSITLMQYRPDIGRKVRKMKIDWKVKPGFGGPLIRGRGENHLFAIIYQENGATSALVLDVPAATMRPYLAEIDVKSGKRVEVKETEEVD